MTYEAKLIAPFDGGGLETYYKPWLIGQEAFPIIEDAYAWRGTVRKREGFVLLGTLPTTPVQGLTTYFVPSSGDESLIAFSKTKAYRFNNTTGVFDNISTFQTSGAAVSWTGGNDNYFWSCNFANSLWTTNNIDPLRFWNGANPNGWNNQKPIVSGTTRLDLCLMVIPYKGRLVVLNTQEGGVAFRQRARWSQIGTPYVLATGADPAVVPPAPFVTQDDAWRDDIPGKGGYTDADTNERIVSCGIVRDTLIVFFQRSTWRLRYTGYQIQPFIWERLNTQYGSESTFSTIAFDEHLLTFSRYGFIAADTNSVQRIDQKIPDQSFEVEAGTTTASLIRIHGIRDFYRQTAIWAYPSENTSTYPDKVLNYNYLDKTFAKFNQKFRCFGYYKTFNDLSWASATTSWEESSFPWLSPWQQADFPQVVAGESNTDSGNVYIVYDIPFANQDQPSFTITNITAANPAVVTISTPYKTDQLYMLDGTKVLINGVVGTMAGTLNGNSFTITTTPVTTFTPTTFSIAVDTSALTYISGGTITGLVNHNFSIYTKRANPYISEGYRCKLGFIDLYCTGTNGGQITVNHFVDDNTDIPILSQKVDLSDLNSDSRYVRVYLGAVARIHQIQITLSIIPLNLSQLSDPQKGAAQFELQGLVWWTRRAGRIKTSNTLLT
jgi:hypothetical protein